MWPFRSKKPVENQTGPDSSYRALEQRVFELERNQKVMHEDWLQYQEKFTRMLARMAKRAKDALEADEEPSRMPQDRRSTDDPYPDMSPAARRLLGGSNGLLPR